MNELAISRPSTIQNDTEFAPTQIAERITAPTSGVATASSTRAGVHGRSRVASDQASTSSPAATRPSRLSAMSAESSWASVLSGRRSITSNSPVRMKFGSSSTWPTARSASPNAVPASP